MYMEELQRINNAYVYVLVVLHMGNMLMAELTRKLETFESNFAV